MVKVGDATVRTPAVLGRVRSGFTAAIALFHKVCLVQRPEHAARGDHYKRVQVGKDGPHVSDGVATPGGVVVLQGFEGVLVVGGLKVVC